MAGYTRQAAANIVTGGVIDAADFNAEYNAIEGAFNAGTGHTHDGTTGNGPPIENVGPAQDLVVTSSVVRPKVTNTYDFGTASIEWKDGFFDGTLRTDILTVDETSTLTGNVTASADVAIGGNLTVTGNATINGNLTFGDADTDSVSFGADITSSLIPDGSTQDLGSNLKQWRDLYIDGTANIDALVADTADINGGNIDGTIIGAASAGAATFTDLTATGTTTVTTADVNGGNIDGTIIGANATADISGSTITGTSLVGPLTGDVSGSVSGNAGTATKLATARNIAGQSFDGTGNISIAPTDLTGVTATATEINKLDGFGGSVADLNYAATLRATGVSETEFDILDGLTASTTELNILDGVTATTSQLNFVDGVTSSIQTQLNGKQATITGGATTITSSNLTANRALISNGSGKVAASSTISTTELGYLNGVTSNIQTQLNNISTSFQLEDGDGNEVTVSSGKEVKFTEGTGINVNWTDTSTGSDGDPYDLEFSLKSDQRFSGTPSVQLGNSTAFFAAGNLNRLQFFTDGDEHLRLETDGDLHCDANIVAFSTTISDKRLKHDIEKIDSALDKVSELNGYTFSYNKNGKKSAGVIAQEVEKVLPSAVENKSLVFHSGEEGVEYKTVQYDQLHGLLIEAIKELKEKLDECKCKKCECE